MSNPVEDLARRIIAAQGPISLAALMRDTASRFDVPGATRTARFETSRIVAMPTLMPKVGTSSRW